MYAEVRGYGMSGDFFNFQIFLKFYYASAISYIVGYCSSPKVMHITLLNHTVTEEEQFWPCHEL